MLELAAVVELELTEAPILRIPLSRIRTGLVFHVRLAFERIETAPLGQPLWTLASVPPGVRRTRIARFEHSVVLVIEPRLIAVAVMHHRQQPTYWMSRLTQL